MHSYDIRRGISLLAVLAMAFIEAGCGGEPPPDPDAPPPPTPEEIAAKIVSDLQLNAPLPARGSRLPRNAAAQFLTAVRTAKTQNSVSEDGKRALDFVSQELDRRLRALEDAELWEHVLNYCDAHLIFDPTSKKFDRYRDKAVVELRKPKVTLGGFYIDGNTNLTAVFMDFYIPTTRMTHRENVRVGEEFYGLKLVEIIGDNQGVSLEYQETGEAFEVLMKR